MKNQEEEIMNAYVSEVEGTTEKAQAEPLQEEKPFVRESVTMTPVIKPMSEIARENRTHGDPEAPVTGNGGLKYKDNIGYLKLPVNSLPSLGWFYPEGTEISIRAARGEEIKHWSTMNDQDIQQLAKTDDILSYMIEKCVNFKIPNRPGNCWKDIKNVDRFYILLAIKEFTFIDGENELMVPITEGKDIPIVKEMINFINIPESIQNFYNSEKRCFTFNVAGTEINMYLPSIGVNNWLKEYATRKTNAREGYDVDFLTYAPMLIRDYRELTVEKYEELVASTRLWSVKEWSVVSHVATMLGDASDPKIRIESDGTEIPLTFRGGIRSLFMLPDPLLNLC